MLDTCCEYSEGVSVVTLSLIVHCAFYFDFRCYYMC